MRYAHARANLLGIDNVHFKQMNAAALDYADGSFDFVFSSMLLHELPLKEVARVFAECHRVLRPGELEGLAVGDGAQAVDAVVAGERVREPHVMELLHGPGREPVAAGLLAREPLAFDEDDVEAVLGRPVRRRRARRPAPDDQQVVTMAGTRRGVAHARTISDRRRRPRRP